MGVDYPPGIDEAPREPGPRETKYAHTASVYGRALLWTLGLILLINLGFQTYNTVLIRHGQVQNRSTLANTATAARNAQTTADSIHSCVTPGEPCFRRAQQQTAGAVASINQVVILAAACAVGKTGSVGAIQIAIQNCVIEGLARQNARSSP